MRNLAEKTACDRVAGGARSNSGGGPMTLLEPCLWAKGRLAGWRGHGAPSSRPQAHSPCLHRRPPDPIGWSLSASSLLPAVAAPSRLSSPGPRSAAGQHLQHCGGAAGFAVSDYPRPGASRDHRPAAPQRGLSGADRPARLPQPHHPAAVPPAIGQARLAPPLRALSAADTSSFSH
jgi:hypothetical protein